MCRETEKYTGKLIKEIFIKTYFARYNFLKNILLISFDAQINDLKSLIKFISTRGPTNTLRQPQQKFLKNTSHPICGHPIGGQNPTFGRIFGK